jgi:hypothetical protein
LKQGSAGLDEAVEERVAVAVFARVASVGDGQSVGKGDWVGSSRPGTCRTLPCPTEKVTAVVAPGPTGMHPAPSTWTKDCGR